MISNWELQNFKSVHKKTELDLAPLTIFAGANSSGKSTIIQSILLIAQTIQNPVYSKSVILNGHIVRFGKFNDIASDNHNNENIKIGFKLIPTVSKTEDPLIYSSRYFYGFEREVSEVRCHLLFNAKEVGEETEIIQLQPKLDESYVSFSWKQAEREDYEILIKRSVKSISERLIEYRLDDKYRNKPLIKTLEFEVIKPQLLIEPERYYRTPKNLKPAGASFHHFLPDFASTIYDLVDEKVRQITEVLTSTSIPMEFYLTEEDGSFLNDNVKEILLNVFNEVLNDGIFKMKIPDIQEKFKTRVENLRNDFKMENLKKCYQIRTVNQIIISKLEPKKPELTKALKGNKKAENTIDHFPFHSAGVDYISSFFRRNLKYLGPLRDEPKPVYELSALSDPRDVGFRGENTAAVLDIHRNTKINYIPSKNFLEGKVKSEIVEISLLDAVLDWLEYMGIASKVTTRDMGKLGHELTVITPGTQNKHDLTHVGVGVSQVLPILVLSLIADHDATLIFEQPELHLHPKVQTRLADFFVSMSLLKKQCIVETHSEYLINRLRFQIALAEGIELSKDIIIYFVDKPDEHTIFNKILINKYGVIEKWPTGFFDESEQIAASMLKAALEKKGKEE